MLQRGRKSSASLAVVPGGQVRLGPVAGLTEGERTVWLATVNSKPADWFGAEHVPLLVNYCRHAARADLLNGQLANFQPEWMETEEGLRRFERLGKMFRDETTAINTLARAMRLTHQSLYRADKAATLSAGVTGRKPWETEES